MARIAFFGAGLLGSGFIRAFRSRGIDVNVWNRTPQKAQALEEFGARAFDSPAAAVRDVERVHLCLSDDEAVDGVLREVVPALNASVPIVDHTTVSPAGVRERYERLTSQRATFLHAPVFMGPPNALEGTGIMLASGPGDRFEQLRPLLAPMTGDVWYVGEREDAAALFKLAGNAMILAVIGGLNDVFSIAEGQRMERGEIARVFERFNPSGQLSGRGQRMAHGDYEPTWTTVMARKDARLMQSAADTQLPVVDAVAALLDRAIREGASAEDLGVIARR